MTTPAPGAFAPHLKSGSGHFGALRLRQMFLIEAAAAVLLVGWAVHPIALVPAAVVAVLLVLLAVVRRRGRSLPVWLATVRGLKARQRLAPGAAQTLELPG